MPFACSRAARRLAVALACATLATACTGNDDQQSSSPTTAARATGVVRIGVWQSPDPDASTYGGAATRSLLYPQLFRATPEGKWEASIVEPGSDVTAPGARSARFRLRKTAVWTDGSRVSVRDLRRTMDARFVQSIEAPTRTGTIVVHFTQKLPSWRRLWSGLDSISPPAEGVYGGPYRLDHVTSGLEAVLVANPRYFDPPRIREVHFVIVQDSEIAARLMERGELDVIAPPAFTNRTQRLERIRNADVVRSPKGGLAVALVANPARLPIEQRRSLFALVDRRRFVDVILHGEAVVAGTAKESATTPTTRAVPAVANPTESPPVNLLVHAMQRLGARTGVTFERRAGEFDEILGSYARSDFDVLVRMQPTTPDRCWVCEAGSVDQALAVAADAHERGAVAKLTQRLSSDALVLPLWRELPVVAVRRGLAGVTANGFSALGPAWNLHAWHWKT